MLSGATIDKKERNRLFLLKFHAMRMVNRMTWDDCAAVYEMETGTPITADKLRHRVKRAVRHSKFVRVSEFPEKVVVSVYELTFFGCFWCSMRKFLTKISNFFIKTKKKPISR